MPRIEEHEAAVLEDDIVRYRRVKKKAYVRLMTNAGALNLELHCEYVPKTCENFIRLCQKGKYDGTKFHRSIKHFMVRVCRLPLSMTFSPSVLAVLPFHSRFKAAIQKAMERAASPFGARRSRTKSNSTSHTLAEAS